MHIDLSNPMDGTFSADEWHHMHVKSTVPMGAYQENMGVLYNQVFDT
jgi:hypothetical protein